MSDRLDILAKVTVEKSGLDEVKSAATSAAAELKKVETGSTNAAAGHDKHTVAANTLKEGLQSLSSRGGQVRETIEGISMASRGGTGAIFGLSKAVQGLWALISNSNPWIKLAAVIAAAGVAIIKVSEHMAHAAAEQKAATEALVKASVDQANAADAIIKPIYQRLENLRLDRLKTELVAVSEGFKRIADDTERAARMILATNQNKEERELGQVDLDLSLGSVTPSEAGKMRAEIHRKHGALALDVEADKANQDISQGTTQETAAAKALFQARMDAGYTRILADNSAKSLPSWMLDKSRVTSEDLSRAQINEDAQRAEVEKQQLTLENTKNRAANGLYSAYDAARVTAIEEQRLKTLQEAYAAAKAEHAAITAAAEALNNAAKAQATLAANEESQTANLTAGRTQRQRGEEVLGQVGIKRDTLNNAYTKAVVDAGQSDPEQELAILRNQLLKGTFNVRPGFGIVRDNAGQIVSGRSDAAAAAAQQGISRTIEQAERLLESGGNVKDVFAKASAALRTYGAVTIETQQNVYDLMEQIAKLAQDIQAVHRKSNAARAYEATAGN